MSTTRSILVLTTAHERMRDGKRTGVWLEELALPFEIFRRAGLDVTVASPRGGDVPIEPRSLPSIDTREHSEAVQALLGTPRLADLDAASFDAVFIPGGHGPMYDLAVDAEVARVLGDFAATERVIAAVCHGPAAFVGATRPDGRPLVEGRRVTGFSDEEEAATGLADELPFLLESTLREQGATYERARVAWEPHVSVDGRLVTGQNPASSAQAAEAVLALLR